MRTSLVIAALLAVALVPAASAAPPELHCTQIYSELTQEPVAVTLVNGCTVRVEVTTGQQGCAERYFGVDYGTVEVESEDTCHYTVEVSAAYPTTSTASGPACPDERREYDLGGVALVLDGCTVEFLPDLRESQQRCLNYIWTFTDPTGTVHVEHGGCTGTRIDVGGQQVFPPTATASSGPQCMDVYQEYPVPYTDYKLVRKNSCAPPVLYEGDEPVTENLLKPSSAAGPGLTGPGLDCYSVYREYHVPGTGFSVVQRSSCSPPELHQNGRPVQFDVVQPASAGCYYVYSETHVPYTDYSIVRRSSCSPPELHEDGEPVTENLLKPSSAAGPEPMCMQVYRDSDYGVVRHLMVDSCEHHVWVAGIQLI